MMSKDNWLCQQMLDVDNTVSTWPSWMQKKLQEKAKQFDSEQSVKPLRGRRTPRTKK